MYNINNIYNEIFLEMLLIQEIRPDTKKWYTKILSESYIL